MFELCSFKWLRGKATFVSSKLEGCELHGDISDPLEGNGTCYNTSCSMPSFLTTEALTASVCGSCARRRPPPIIEIRSRGP